MAVEFAACVRRDASIEAWLQRHAHDGDTQADDTFVLARNTHKTHDDGCKARHT